MIFVGVVTEEVATGLVVLQVKLVLQLDDPEDMVQLEAVRVPDIGGGFTVTAVQGVLALQLLPSFDSAIVPLTSPAELLSAQARTYQVPEEAKVMAFEVTAFPPLAARAAMPVTG